MVIACICIADERKFQKVMLSFNVANDEVANRPLNHYKLFGGNGGYFPTIISITWVVMKAAVV